MVLACLLAVSTAPWQQAVPGYQFSFPRDHFEHPAFRSEWWYYTGNVWTKEGRRFGFELVFFRFGDRSTDRTNPSAWRVDDVYVAHAALTDVREKRFRWAERVNRAGPGIAGASYQEKRVWNGNWSDAWSGERQTLSARTPDFSFHLVCAPAKPFVLQGDRGLSQKAEGAGRASYYVSFPLLRVLGEIEANGETLPVSGQAWMDHEWFSNQLAPNQIGWDWFSIQLNDNSELMLFELRRKDGTIDPYSSGTFIGPSGDTHRLTGADFQLKPLAKWKSAKSGGEYPVEWTIDLPARNLHLRCRAVLRDQELHLTHGSNYWEGAVDFDGSQRGYGYLEMTGYDKPVIIGER